MEKEVFTVIALTHITFVVATSLMLGAESTTTLALAGIGSLPPDIDHSKNTVGKIHLPISVYTFISPYFL